MKVRILIIAGVVLLLALSSVAQSPVATVNAFYKFDRSHPEVFNRRNIDSRKRWFSKDLYNLFLYELKRESAYLKKTPTDKPYFGDGLPFEPYDETCKAGRRELHRTVV